LLALMIMVSLPAPALKTSIPPLPIRMSSPMPATNISSSLAPVRGILISEFYSFKFRDRRKMWQFFSNEVSFIWLRPPTHPLQMKVWKTEYRCIINQTPPINIGFRTMYFPYACHDKGSIYEYLSFQNHRHLISGWVGGLSQMKLTSLEKNCHILRRSLNLYE
jgi:hypothetical protein